MLKYYESYCVPLKLSGRKTVAHTYYAIKQLVDLGPSVSMAASCPPSGFLAL